MSAKKARRVVEDHARTGTRNVLDDWGILIIPQKLEFVKEFEK